MKLFKYLPRKHLESFIREGVFLFRPLSYFQDFEDAQVRGDKHDGVLKHSKEGGLDINYPTTGVSEKLKASFESSVDSENIFVFCTSQKLCPNLAAEFESDVCVEISSPQIIISMLNSAVARRKTVKPNKLFHSTVHYYKEEDAPGIKWAFPDQIALQKLQVFQGQEEYRFMFSLKNALEFNRTEQKLHFAEPVKNQRITPYPEHKLKVGNISRWCNIHEFT